jgi:hypothetical protein
MTDNTQTLQDSEQVELAKRLMFKILGESEVRTFINSHLPNWLLKSGDDNGTPYAVLVTRQQFNSRLELFNVIKRIWAITSQPKLRSDAFVNAIKPLSVGFDVDDIHFPQFLEINHHPDLFIDVMGNHDNPTFSLCVNLTTHFKSAVTAIDVFMAHEITSFLGKNTKDAEYRHLIPSSENIFKEPAQGPWEDSFILQLEDAIRAAHAGQTLHATYKRIDVPKS